MSSSSEEMKSVEKIKPAGSLQAGPPLFPRRTSRPSLTLSVGLGSTCPRNAGGEPEVVSRVWPVGMFLKG